MLAGSLSAERVDGGVRFTLVVENEGDEPLTLSFPSGRRADFAVRDRDRDGPGVDGGGNESGDDGGSADGTGAKGEDGARTEEEGGARTDRGGGAGNEAWRWSDGRLFTQVLGSETIGAGESLAFEGTWESPAPGEYVAVGELTAADREVVAEVDLSV